MSLFLKMDFSSLNEIKKKTEEFIKDPLQEWFIKKIPESEVEYYQIIKNPMYFNKIVDKINKNLYNNFDEWYDDVCQIYRNCIRFYHSQDFEYQIAFHCLKKFQKLMKHKRTISNKEWCQNIERKMNKFIKILTTGPIIQGVDTYLSIFDESNMIKGGPIEEMETNLSIRAHNPEVRTNIINIIKKKDPNYPLNSKPLKIDLSKLQIDAKNALSEYSKVLQ